MTQRYGASRLSSVLLNRWNVSMWDELKDILDNPFPLYYLMWSLIVIVQTESYLSSKQTDSYHCGKFLKV